MKKLVLLSAMLVLAMVAVVAVGKITSSKHDFSDEGWGGEICEPCHVPHGASTDNSLPLWGHSNTVASFTMYDNTTNSQDSAAATTVSGASKMCLSCHDGTIAIDAFSGNGLAGKKINDASGFNRSVVGSGADLSGEHPISITYDATLFGKDAGLKDPTNVASWLVGDKIECGTCHDVHADTSETNLLRVTMTASALCLKCHDLYGWSGSIHATSNVPVQGADDSF